MKYVPKKQLSSNTIDPKSNGSEITEHYMKITIRSNKLFQEEVQESEIVEPEQVIEE